MDKTQIHVETSNGTVAAKRPVPEATCSVRLSERDEAELMATAENPPLPNEAALKAAKRFKQSHG
jgi:uncharacterized protein (DUF1778 family)